MKMPHHHGSELEQVVLSNSNNVDFYNFLLDYVNDPVVGSTAQGSRRGLVRKLKIIPENVTQGLIGDFMKPRIQELDLICSTKGAEAWVNKLKWDGLQNFLSLDRSPLSCRSDNTTTKGFTSSYKNLFFYWILGAGHFVPAEQPCISLQMVGNVTKSPNNF
ncbi:SERINE PROTEASE FAMILY S10 SERINE CARBOXYPEPTIDASE [Salix purpurea]|uniref:SERINE PROTEASE FAMILY S10 SERINE CARBOXYPEPTIDASE n=1 Tax=Salix purpurea TaxID=77065 RepID=A0A9Q0T3L2_SALPP|nr:SERINE PROTEASE FAMILY S10 SERINE CARBOXYPEPTIDASE [Salix purpurea]